MPYRIRRKRYENQVRGRYRLNIFKSNNHIYAAVIDDEERHTLCAASTMDPGLRESLPNGANIPAAAAVGKLLAERLHEKGIDKLYYDRVSGSHKYKYHGRIKALVDATRDGGITI